MLKKIWTQNLSQNLTKWTEWYSQILLKNKIGPFHLLGALLDLKIKGLKKYWKKLKLKRSSKKRKICLIQRLKPKQTLQKSQISQIKLTIRFQNLSINLLQFRMLIKRINRMQPLKLNQTSQTLRQTLRMIRSQRRLKSQSQLLLKKKNLNKILNLKKKRNWSKNLKKKNRSKNHQKIKPIMLLNNNKMLLNL